MNERNPGRRLERHRNFWARGPADRPLAGFRIQEDYIPARWMECSARLLETGREILPEDLDVDACLAEYEALFERHESSGQDFFWTAEPLTGIPWMEAIMGGRVIAAKDSFVIEPGMCDPESDSFGILQDRNPWFLKYMEFVTRLGTLARGRFAVGQPIMRGPLDTICALMTIPETVYAFVDRPEWIASRLSRLSDSFIRLVRAHQDAAAPFHGGSSIGFYHLWAPGRCVWLQEDATSFLSPALYRDFQADNDRRVLACLPYSLFHLHPASFFILDELLAMDSLKVIQVNRDVNGPSIESMLPFLLRVLESKRLLLWGEFSEPEVRQLLDGLPARGLALQLFVRTPEQGRDWMDRIFGSQVAES